MNQKQIVFEHRAALDAFEAAQAKQHTCSRKGTCRDEVYCLTCPARLEKRRCEEILEIKSKALQRVNERIIKQNDEQALQMRIDRLNGRKAKSIKKERASSMSSQLNYSRKDLTAERYVQYREEGKTDREIREMYDIPRGSFGKIKKDLLAQLEPIDTPNDVVEFVEVEIEQAATTEVVEEIEEPTVTLKPQITVQAEDVGLRLKITRLEKEYDSVVSQLKQTIENNNELQKQVITANNQLTQEQQFSNELKGMVDFLENKLKEQLPVEQNETSVEQDKVNYKALYEETLEKLDATGDLAENYLREIEQLQAKFNELVHSSNKQIHMVKDYEITLLERLLQELYANRN